MGLVVSRLWTTKKSFRDHLGDLEVEIKRIETAQQRNAIIKRQLISSIVLWSSVIYIFSFVAYYLLALPPTWAERVMYAFPFFIAPFFIYLINRYVHYFLERRYHKYGVKLHQLRQEKKKVLEEVIETESFKNAKELLERFDPQSTFLRPSLLNSSVVSHPEQGTPNTPSTPRPGMQLRRRRLDKEGGTPARPVAAATPQPRPATPPKRSVKPQRKLLKPQGEVSPILKPHVAPKVLSSCSTQTTPAKADKIIPTGVANRSPQIQIVREYLLPGHVKNERAGGPPQPLQILPADRTSMDKFVEFVIGDGPNNRYALICSQCHSHNGMTLAEDFEYTTFRCAYCYTVNTARRNTPIIQQGLYKLPNLQVKSPTIVKEIMPCEEEDTSTMDTTAVDTSIVDNCAVDNCAVDTSAVDTSAVDDDENVDDNDVSVHETPEKDITELLDEADDVDINVDTNVDTHDVAC